MKPSLHTPFAICHLPSLILAAALALPLHAPAGPITLATAPLANATTTSVLPNLMFILDDSGSMGSDYLPDWVNGNYCKAVPTTTGATSDCYPGSRGLPPYTSSDFNRIYYDPSITYAVPWDASLATPANKTSYPGSGNTPMDGYGIQTASTTALTTSYPDVEYCTDATYSDCLRNDNYLLPGTVNSKSYTTKHETTAAGSKSVATGTVAAPTTATRTLGPYYYVMVPGEYCTDLGMTSCITAAAPDAAHPFPARVRWCNSTDLSTCKATQDSTYQYARYPTVVITAGVAAGVSSGQITATNTPQSTCSGGGCTKPTCTISASSSSCTAGTVAACNALASTAKTVITSIKLISASHPAPGTELLMESLTYCNGSGTSSTRNNGLAAAIQARIGNSFIASLPGSSNIVAITTPDGTYNAATLNASWTSAAAFSLAITTAFSGGSAAVDPVVVPGSFQRVDIVTGQTYGNIVVGTTTIVNRTTRTDCAAAPNCTYAEELSNFANWYAWYRTRMQMMKTSASRAFKTIDNKYRVGFITIDKAPTTNQYLKIDTFNSGAGNQKAKWYAMLFAQNPSPYTPLRGALSRVGRIFAGKNPLALSPSDDPMQYSCQQNFALLTTDGYWNTHDETASYGPNTVSGGALGNMDGGSTPRPMYEGPSASSGSLADVAKYYYDTDLRTSALGNCTGSLGLDVCENNVFVSSTDNNVQQHMTTFTLGLGVDGTLVYQSDYKTATSGDYYKLKNGLSTTVGGVTTAVNWPVPVSDTVTAVDDLWHAAVNGQGSYFSAKNPAELASGLNDALAAIGAKIGSGAAAATSTLNPVSGNNYAYVASYTTVRWTGNLEARSINIDTGDVSEAATWCVENTVAGTCIAPGAVVAETSGASTIYNCVTPGATAGTCASPGVLVGTECKVELPVACTGTMAAKVGAASDSRTIYTKGSAGSLVPFVYANLNATDFDATKLATLSQWPLLTAAQKTTAAGANLVNFLRGQNGYEDRASNAVNDRLYRYRDAVLGDAVESQPAYLAKPTFSYTDPGYSAYQTAQAGRAGTVYMGTNDGMMHAFNAANGQERWAYVPSMVIPNMWKLADKNYSTMHTYYVNGSAVISDFCTANCALSSATWKTILVAGLNGGGRGYYALDITTPTAPTLLWEYTTANQNNLGYSFGKPVVTKKTDGTWVVLVTSGYNNTSPGNGQGYLYVLNALTGAEISAYPTGVGSSSGLSQISVWADSPEIDNTAGYVYGGDLAGNLWRFDINKASGATGAVVLFATLKDAAGAAQPITTRPELGKIEGKRAVFVATGKYLETADLTDTQQQTLYAIKDADDYPTATPTATLVNPRLTLVQQTLTTAGAIRTDTANAVDFKTGRGWYVNFPDSGERCNVDPQLLLGVLLVPTTVPSSTVCSPGGFGWLNYFNYKTGSNTEDSKVGVKFNAPIVGLSIVTLPSGTPSPLVTIADNPTPKTPFPPSGSGGSPSGPWGNSSTSAQFVGKRVIWRELIQ